MKARDQPPLSGNAEAELTKAAEAVSGLLELAKVSAAAGRTGASDLN